MQYYRNQIEELAKRICADMHIALYDVDEKMSVKGRIITVFLTKIGGISLDECARFSRRLSNELDEFDLIQDRYFLEVSSPGVERALKLKSHYMSAINDKVYVQYQEAEERKHITGILTEVNQDTITVRLNDTDTIILFTKIIKAKTEFSW